VTKTDQDGPAATPPPAVIYEALMIFHQRLFLLPIGCGAFPHDWPDLQHCGDLSSLATI